MSAPWGSTERVPFDFDASLALARRLWLLADEVDHVRATRDTTADNARTRWQGAKRDDFDRRTTDEEASAIRAAGALRDEATGWANAWRDALDEQNRRNRAQRITQIRDNRSWAEANIGDRVLGDDSDEQVPDEPVVTAPQPPQFLPTQDETTFSEYG